MNFPDKFFVKYSDEKLIRWFRQVSVAEAISWCLLFSAMVWIRYDRDGLWPAVYIIIMGNIHGLFFTLYLVLLWPTRKIFRWDDEDTVFAVIAAFFPFATVWAEKKLARFNREEL